MDLAAVIDVDDIRQLVVAGHAAPWDGPEGIRQQRLGVENACGLARRFLEAGIEVVLADVVDASTISPYRGRLPGLLAVRLRLSLEAARHRAAQRPIHLTSAEFDALHAREAGGPVVDEVIDVDGLGLDEQCAAVRAAWRPSV